MAHRDTAALEKGMQSVLLPSCILVCVVTAIALVAAREGCSLPPSEEFEYREERRFYDVRLPADYDPAETYPLLLVLHGGGSSASRVEALTDGTRKALAKGYIVVYPEGVDGDWNDGRASSHSRSARSNIDDVGYLHEVIRRIGVDYRADLSQVFLAGVANGGMMALRFACERSEELAGVAVFSASLPKPLAAPCAESAPVPALFIHGVEDTIAPYGGGEMMFLGNPRGSILPVDEMVALWVRRNGCASSPVSAVLPDLATNDGATATQLKYCGEDKDAAVWFYRIDGGGHGVPGVSQGAADALLGNNSMDFHAVDAALAFFGSLRDAAPSATN